MSRLSIALVASLLVALVVADVQLQLNFNAPVWSGPITTNDVCNRVGIASGCSGCVLGTKNLCKWVAREEGVSKRALGSVDVLFSCVPADDLPRLLLEGYYSDASHLCPADPSKEPLIKDTISMVEINTLPRISTAFSTAHTTALADFPVQPWFVDRFSYAGAVGYAAQEDGRNGENALDCAHVTSEDLLTFTYDPNGAESTLFNGYLVNERDKYCARLGLAGFIASRCPQYGKAVSGLCQSFYDQIQTNCGRDSGVHVGPNSYNGDSSAFEPYYVVPDGTPFCLDSFPVKASGRMEHLHGLDIPIEKLEKMLADGKAFEFDWPPFHVAPAP